jgi:hypothetical protein
MDFDVLADGRIFKATKSAALLTSAPSTASPAGIYMMSLTSEELI